MTKVVNCINEPYDVYIGRPSKWGNPFNVGQDGNRTEVIKKYLLWLLGEIDPPEHHHWYVAPTVHEILSLNGKTLGCWCKPKECHGDALIEIITAFKENKKNERQVCSN